MSSFPAKKRRVALFGGSFNPPHEGHLRGPLFIHNALKTDEVWLLVARQNPLKDPAVYAPMEHRVAMCEIMAEPYQSWLKVNDFEKNTTSIQTADTLRDMQQAYPDCEFIWVMGMDNLNDFHHWNQWQEIIDNYPIAVLRRGPEKKVTEALASPAAQYAKKLQCDNPEELGRGGPGWCIMNNDGWDVKARDVVADIRSGKTGISSIFNGLAKSGEFPHFRKVAEYIVVNGLYVPKPGEAPPAFKI